MFGLAHKKRVSFDGDQPRGILVGGWIPLPCITGHSLEIGKRSLNIPKICSTPCPTGAVSVVAELEKIQNRLWNCFLVD